jgi:hypothetical protein
MFDMTDEKKNDDYYVYFKGAKLTKRQANIAGLSIIFGIICSIMLILFTTINKTSALSIITFVTLAGAAIGMRIWKR